MKIFLVAQFLAVVVVSLATSSSSSQPYYPREAIRRFKNSDMLARHHRILEDSNDGGDGDSNFNCDYNMDDGFEMVCTLCTEDNLCMTETCTTDASYEYLYCNVCVTADEGGEFNEFCMTSNCDMNSYLEDDATMEDACTCEGASIDGVECDSCEFCPNDGIDYDLQTQMENGDVADGIALQCPAYTGLNSTCAAINPRSSTSSQTKLIVGILSPLVAIAAIAGAYFIIKSKQDSNNDPKKFNLVEDGKEGSGVEATSA